MIAATVAYKRERAKASKKSRFIVKISPRFHEDIWFGTDELDISTTAGIVHVWPELVVSPEQETAVAEGQHLAARGNLQLVFKRSEGAHPFTISYGAEMLSIDEVLIKRNMLAGGRAPRGRVD